MPVSCRPEKTQQGEVSMPAYFVVELEITNYAAMEP